MHVELDHLFVCASPGAPGLRNSFGSACGKVLQICIQVKAQQIGVSHLPTLSVSDGAEARNECTRRTLLWERWSGRERETSPFGFCVRPARVPYIQPPIPAWEYRPSYLPDPRCIHVAETGVAEPMGTYLSFMPGLDHEQSLLAHAVGIRKITALTLTTPVPLRSFAS